MGADWLRKKLGRQKGQCTWCGEPVSKGRRTWCSDKCVDAYRAEYDWQWIRRQIEKRDHGVCGACGCDTIRLRDMVYRVRRHSYSAYRLLLKHLATLGFPSSTCRDWWEADHILPRVKGGTHALDNLRTLCVRCHKAATRALAAERKAERRDAKRPVLR